MTNFDRNSLKVVQKFEISSALCHPRLNKVKTNSVVVTWTLIVLEHNVAAIKLMQGKLYDNGI